MIYKCVMCDTVFTQKPLLYMHFDTHLAKQKVHVFKCPDCTKLYAQKGSMMEHIKVSLGGPLRCVRPSALRVALSLLSSMNVASAKANSNSWIGLWRVPHGDLVRSSMPRTDCRFWLKSC